MPVTILNPHRSEPWAHAVQGLSGALEAFQRYKSEDRDYKLKLEEAKLRREESEQMRKQRDQDMAFRADQQERLAREDARVEEEDKVKRSGERHALLADFIKGGGLGPAEPDFGPAKIATDIAKPGEQAPTIELPGMQPSPSTSADAAPALETIGKIEELTPGLRYQGRELQKRQAEDREAAKQAQLDQLRETIASPGDITIMGQAYKKGERIPAAAWQIHAAELGQDAAAKRQEALFKQQSQIQDARDRAAERRANITQTAAAAKNAEKVGARLRVEYTKDITKPRERLRAMERGLQMGAPATPTATSDYSLVYAFAKASDPDSAVREGEFQGVKSNIGGWPQQAQQYFRDIVDGKMTPQKRQEMVETINRGLDYEKKTMEGIDTHYRNLADVEDVDAARIFGTTNEPKGKVDPNDPDGLLSPTEKAMREATGNTLGLKKPGSR